MLGRIINAWKVVCGRVHCCEGNMAGGVPSCHPADGERWPKD